MALNQKFNDGDQFDVAAADVLPADPASGDPVIVGQLPAVALTDPAADGTGADRITVKTNGVYDLAVTGADDLGNAAIAVGDVIYLEGPTLNVDAVAGVRYGYALATVASGATSTIPVKIGY